MKQLSFLTLGVLLCLTACNQKPAETPTANPTQAQVSTETTTPANTAQTPTDPAMPADIEKLIIQSPYMDFVVNSNRAIVISEIKSEFELTPEQTACLQGLESNTTYLETLDPFVKSVLNEEEIKEADEFFASDAGRKFGEMMLKQFGATNLPPSTEPTASEKAEIAKALLKPFFVKIKAKNDAMSEQEALDFTLPMMKKEMARCGIS